jgi:dienelactone hydrolase
MVDPARLASVRYYFGGTVGIEPIELERRCSASCRCTARSTTSRRMPPNIKGRVLILRGAEDPVPPMEEVNSLISQLRAEKVDLELNLYSGTTHGFTRPQNPSEVRADEEYNVAMTRFFKDVLEHRAPLSTNWVS